MTDGEQADVTVIGAVAAAWMYVCSLVSVLEFILSP